ncbi:major capsid protein [Enterobacter hormaechei]|uniref:major capsid protein n=1 Tax=Enterobacteriaceae TaxID=543 RepID=UPI000CFBA91B|nr:MULTISPECIES: major capsid protein [Enterobacteriaceae]ELG9927755.1 major capsid protein [Pluralibacter gergoviae]HCM9428653.1 major capsid protein [Enterobacter hormaechei subsp. xiangfangensis]EFC7750108.1 major capsid protein E [Escherichia coli]EGI4586363.1 major capsid protein E [Escherichia coli]EGM8680992.1 major capsid protein E [Escherichia coli]
MAIDFKQFEKLDTVAAIKDVPAGNYLISDLGIFTPVNSTTPNAQVVDIVETQVSELEQVARYGTEVNAIKMDKTILRNQEIPHYATEADVKTADWQGLVSPANPDQVAAVTSVIASKAIRMRNHHLETVESTLARALFKQEAKAAKTDDGDVDFNAVFGATPLDFELDGSAGANVYAQLAKVRRMLVKEYGASRSYVDRFFCFCSPDLYDVLASHPEVTSLITNKVAEAAKGAMIPVNTAGYDSFSIGNITFILADDDRYEIAEGSGLFVPKFSTADRNPFKLVHGPASRNQDIAAKGVISPYYQKVMTDRYGMVTIHQESSHISLVLRPSYLLNVKLK